MIKLIALIALQLACLGLKAQTNLNSIKIYARRDTMQFWDAKYKSDINWSFIKVDMKEESIQYSTDFTLIGGDKAPDLSNVSQLFNDQSKKYFKVINATKYKIPGFKGSKRKRQWFDFATSGRSGSYPATTITVSQNKFGNYTYDELLTKQYHQEQK